jgi:hypothetical protein
MEHPTQAYGVLLTSQIGLDIYVCSKWKEQREPGAIPLGNCQLVFTQVAALVYKPAYTLPLFATSRWIRTFVDWHISGLPVCCPA